MTWLVFYPRTVVRIARPDAATRYSEDEQKDDAAEQYTDTLSPPLLLMLRALLFSVLPLVAATNLLRRQGLALDRKALRGPFFSQCYLAAPFALAVSAGLVLVRTPPGAA